jgi:hypothetical protein
MIFEEDEDFLILKEDNKFEEVVSKEVDEKEETPLKNWNQMKRSI